MTDPCSKQVYQSPIALCSDCSTVICGRDHEFKQSFLPLDGRGGIDCPTLAIVSDYRYNETKNQWDVKSPALIVKSNELVYRLTQFHFHQPGEHTLNSKRYPIEIHFVFESADGHILALGYVASVVTSQETKVTPGRNSMNSSKVIRSILKGKPFLLPRLDKLWSYTGSLTEPPLGKNINWLVSDHVLRITSADLAALAPMSKASRPVQPRSGRVIAFVDPR